MESSRSEKITPACYVALAITILAPLMGGSTRLWAEAVLAICAGLAFLIFPPTRSLGRFLNVVFVLLFLLALTAFLPARWFPPAIWRSEFIAIGVELPSTISAQPWLTLESALLLFVGLCWAYYVLAGSWSLPCRSMSWSVMGGAYTALAALLIVGFALRYQIPFWPRTPEYGFFPNRNHTSNVLGLGGVLVYALAFRWLDEGRRTWWIWVVAFACIFWALIVNYSRAGIILLFGGVLVWDLVWLFTSRYKRTPLITAIVIGLLLGFFIFGGGKTALRFGRETTDFFSDPERGRLGIYHDAAELSLHAPLTGGGLGNFSPLFTMNRHECDQSIAVHPESDWLWMVVEMGWLAPLLVAACIGVYAARSPPFERGTFRLMRLAAFVCGGGFVLHTFFDVPGHQMGALWPALFLSSTAPHPASPFALSRATPVVFRFLGLLSIAIGVWWFASILGPPRLPTTATLHRSLRQIESAGDREDYETMEKVASEALRIAPLNWELYFKRGFAEAALYRPRADILRDFAAARYLLPNWTDLYVKEGQVWLAVGEPDLAFDVWHEAMKRLADQAPNLYKQIFPLIKSDADLRERWRDLAGSNKSCVLTFLYNAEPTEFAIELQRLFAEDPQLQSFTPAELKTLFHIWYERGDKLSLAETLRQHPEWQKIAWRELARVYAEHQDYRQAYETVVRFSPPPRFPEIDSRESIESLAQRFRISGNIENDGLRLALAEANHGEVDDALALLKALLAMPGAPRFLHFLEGDIWARKGEWQKAWQAISQSQSLSD